MEHSESLTKLVPALIAAQKTYAPLKKDKVNPHFGSKYADLADVITATQPSLNANGLTVVDSVQFADGSTVVNTILIHESGEYMRESLRIPGVQSNAQHVIAASTYARRGQRVALTGIAADDDMDGNIPPPKSKQPSPPDPPKVNQTPAQPTTAARPQERSSQPRTATGKPETPQANSAALVQTDPSPKAETVQKTDDLPYTKEEYNAEIVPKIKALYEGNDDRKKEVIAAIKSAYPKETKDYTRSEWAEVFTKLEAK